MARHPSSQFKREFDFGSGRVERPVDALGHCRSFATIEQRAIKRASDGTIGFRGHAAVFNSRVLIGSKRWGFYEEFAPGCFRKTLQEADVRFLVNHDPNLVLARNKAGSLRLAEDETGLPVDADMGPYSYAADLATALERGDITQMSIAFDPITYETTEHATDGLLIVRHTEVRLWDVSAVTYPAYTDTDAALRSALQRVTDRFGVPLDELAGLDDDDFAERLERSRERIVVTKDVPVVDAAASGERAAQSEVDAPDAPVVAKCVTCGATPDASRAADDGGPAESTRTPTPPAETTGIPKPSFSRFAEHRLRELGDLFSEGDPA